MMDPSRDFRSAGGQHDRDACDVCRRRFGDARRVENELMLCPEHEYRRGELAPLWDDLIRAVHATADAVERRRAASRTGARRADPHDDRYFAHDVYETGVVNAQGLRDAARAAFDRLRREIAA